jgi:Cys-rich protein (TIGR01571 family)
LTIIAMVANANEPIVHDNSAGTTQQYPGGGAPVKQNPPPLAGDTKSKTDEIKAGGAKGFFGLDQVDWGETNKGGKCWEFWKCEPQCGSPINGRAAALCCVTWWCCGVCAEARLYASTLDQPCACVPHMLMACCCGVCTACFTRYHVRKRHAIPGNIAGDFWCSYCCGCCSGLQVLRTVPVTDWAILDPIPEFIGKVPDIILVK